MTVPGNDAVVTQIDVTKLRAEVDKLADQLRTRVRQAPEGARAVLEESLERLAGPAREAAVVVVGETKKGKSSVVNALVGRPGLSPVAVDVATATYVFFRHGADGATVFPPDTADPAGEPIGLGAVAQWVTVDGLAGNPRVKKTIGADEVDVSRPVLVSLPTPLLERFAVIDTPGVGGLDGSHGDVTRTAVHLASAMLFVTDITSPLTSTEVKFLDEVADRVGEVVIALNMADKLAGPDLEAAVADARGKIDERLHRYRHCPLVTISARRAEQANDPGLPPAARARLRQLAGLDELEQVLTERVSRRAALLTEIVRLRVVAEASETLMATLRTAMARAEPGGDRTLQQVRDEHAHLPTDVGAAQAMVAHDLGQLQRSLTSHLDGRLRALRAEVSERVQRHTPLTEIGPFVEGELSQFAEEVSTLLATGTRAAVTSALGEAAEDPLFIAASDKAVAEAAAKVDLRDALAPGQVRLGPDAIYQSSIGMMSGISLGGTVTSAIRGFGGTSAAAGSTVGLAGVFAVVSPVALVLAGVTLGANLIINKRRLRQGQTTTWARDRVEQAQRDLLDSVAGRIGEANYLVATALRTWSRLRGDVLREELRMLEASTHERARQLATATLALREGERVGHGARALLELATAPPSGTSPPALRS